MIGITNGVGVTSFCIEEGIKYVGSSYFFFSSLLFLLRINILISLLLNVFL